MKCNRKRNYDWCVYKKILEVRRGKAQQPGKFYSQIQIICFSSAPSPDQPGELCSDLKMNHRGTCTYRLVSRHAGKVLESTFPISISRSRNVSNHLYLALESVPENINYKILKRKKCYLLVFEVSLSLFKTKFIYEFKHWTSGWFHWCIKLFTILLITPGRVIRIPPNLK